MPNPLSSIAIQQFRDVFTNKYQAMRKLAGTTQEIHGVIGDAYKWPVLGNDDMDDRGSYQSIIPASELDHTQVTTTFSDKVKKFVVDRGEQTLVNANERDQLATKHAAANGRQIDQFVIDALDAASTNVILNGGTNMTLEKLIQARTDLLKQNAPMDGLMCAIHADQLEAMLKLEKLTSADYNTVRALVNGEINTFMGFKFIVFGDAATAKNIGTLPKTGDIRSCFAWHRDAVGLVMKLDPVVNIEWSTERVSWISVSQLIGGASAILEEGIVKIDCDETA